ncbi:hypothetical protein K435DRAFT_563025, partial [Dendrothele bispora CBS 962.96]
KRLRWEQKYGHLTPEEACAEQAKLWSRPGSSPVYQHFHPPIVEEYKGRMMHVFVCKKCVHSVLSAILSPYEDSTGNFNAHIARCDPQKKGNIANYAAGSTYSAPKF